MQKTALGFYRGSDYDQIIESCLVFHSVNATVAAVLVSSMQRSCQVI